jgi:excisionase family DNA binding protein
MAVKNPPKRVAYEPGKLPELLDVRDVQRELRIGKTTIYKLVKHGVLKKVKLGSRSLFTRDSVQGVIAIGLKAAKS